MALTLRQYLFFVFLILVILGCSACGQKTSQPLRLGTNIWPGYEPLYLAQNLELWQRDEIRLVEYPSASEVLRAFRNKSLEAASLTLDEALLLRQLNIPIKIILVHDISEGADVILARPPIKTVAELRGIRVGVESGALGAFVLTRALELNNMNLTEIEVVNIDVNLHESAYQNKRVDAVVTFDPVRTHLLSAGANEIFSSREIPGEIVDVLVVHQDFLDKNPTTIKKLLNGWFTSLEQMNKYPGRAENMIATRLKISPQEVRTSYEGLTFPSREENRNLLGKKNPKLGKTIKHLSRTMLKNKLIANEIITSGLLSDAYL